MIKPAGVPKEVGDFLAERKLKVTTLLPIHVHHEHKPEKFDSKVLGLTHCRLFILSTKSPIKMETTVHFLDIKLLSSPNSNQLILKAQDGKSLSLSNAEQSSGDIDRIIVLMGESMAGIFPHTPLQSLVGEVSVKPESRLQPMLDAVKETEGQDPRPCAGFTRMYRCMCDYHSCPLMEEVVWDLNTIYLSQNSREMILHDFDHLSARDHVPLLSALQYSSWFTRVDVSGMKLNADALVEILKVMKTNTAIEEWNLSGIGIKMDFMQKVAAALSANPATAVSTLNLSENLIEDKGLAYLASAVSGLRKGIQSLNVSQCGATAKGLGKLADAFLENKAVAASMHTLTLAGNSFKNDDLTVLCTFLAQPNALKKLDMSFTDFPIDTLIAALSRGCVLNLEELNLSGNPFSNKKGKESSITQCWKQFFSSALALTKVNLSASRLGPTALKQLLLGLSSNVNQPRVYLDISANDLKMEGANVLGSCIGQLNNVYGLDISDNGLETSLPEIFPWLANNRQLVHLSVGRNFSNMRPKQLTGALESLVKAIQAEDCALKSLNISDSKLKVETTIIINALGSNNTLETLDISGNAMGDIGAKMLAKALTINTTLTSVRIDRNGVTAQGLHDIALALEKNRSLLELPVPVMDLMAAAKLQPDVAQSAVEKIQASLQRNHSPQRVTFDPNYRLQQGFLVSSTRNVIDKYIGSLVEQTRRLKHDNATHSLSPESVSALAGTAQSLISDADNSKQILTRLQDVASQCETGSNFLSADLEKVAKDLCVTFTKQLSHNVDEMLATARSVCPHITEREAVFQKLQGGCADRVRVDDRFLHSLVTKKLAADIGNKVSHLNFTVASFISDTVIDTVVESLAEHFGKMGQAIFGSGKPGGDNNEDSLSNQEADNGSGIVRTDEEGDGSKRVTTPGDERKSVMMDIKRRPQSVRDIQMDYGRDRSDSSPKANSRSRPQPKVKQDDGLFSDLPTTSAPSLTHITKDRPRRPKTKQVRPNYRGSDALSIDSTETAASGVAASEGMDTFFEAAPTPPSQPVMVQPPPTPTPEKKQEATAPPPEKSGSPKSEKKKAPLKTKDKQSSSSGLFGGLFKKKEKKESVEKGSTSKAKKHSVEKISEEHKVQEPALAAVEEPKSPGSPTAKSREGATMEESGPLVKGRPSTSSMKSSGSADMDRSISTDDNRKEEGGAADKEDEDSHPKAAPRRVMGVGMPGMAGMMGGMATGDAASMMAEMKAKRQLLSTADKPKGHVPSQALKPPPRPISKPSSVRLSKSPFNPDAGDPRVKTPGVEGPKQTGKETVTENTVNKTGSKVEKPPLKTTSDAKDVSGNSSDDSKPSPAGRKSSFIKDKPRSGSVNKPSPARPAPPSATAKPVSVTSETGGAAHGDGVPAAASKGPPPTEKPKPLRPPKPAAKPRPAVRPTTIDASELLGNKESANKSGSAATTPASPRPSTPGSAAMSPLTPSVALADSVQEMVSPSMDTSEKPGQGPSMKAPEKGAVARPPPPANLGAKTGSVSSLASGPGSPSVTGPLSPTGSGKKNFNDVIDGGDKSKVAEVFANGNGMVSTVAGGSSGEELEDDEV